MSRSLFDAASASMPQALRISFTSVLGFIATVLVIVWGTFVLVFNAEEKNASNPRVNVTETEKVPEAHCATRTDPDISPEPKAADSPAEDSSPRGAIAIGKKNDSGASTDSSSTWRCACEGGFLPPGLLRNFAGAEAVMRLGTGQCYHKQM